MSYDQYNALVSSNRITKNLRPGCYYYIEDTSRKKLELRTVYHGKYLRTEGKTKVFEDIKIIVNPLRETAKPLGFINRVEYIIDNSMQCDEDFSNKNEAVKELKGVINELKVRPIEEGEAAVSFFGEDYRDERDNFNRNIGNNPRGGKKLKNTKRNKNKRLIRKRTQKKRHNK